MNTDEQTGGLAHQVAGPDDPTAPVVLFVHGAAWAGVSWCRQVEALRDTFRCVTVDLPGHGGSRDIPWTTLNGAADHVAEVLRALPRHGPAALVGFSLGADVGLRLLARHPELFASALLTGVITHPVSRLEQVLDAATSPFVALPPVHHVVARSMRLPDDVRREFLRTSKPLRVADYRRLSAQILAGTSLSGLADVREPVLVLAGAKESDDARISAREAAAVLPNAIWAWVPDQRHAWPVNDAALFTAVLRQWLRDPGTLPAALADAEHDAQNRP